MRSENKPFCREGGSVNRHTTQQNKNSSGVSRKHFRFDRGWCFVIFLLLLVAVIYCVVCSSKSFDFFLVLANKFIIDFIMSVC